MPIPFSDFGKACSDLFNDHHQAGAFKVSKKGACGNGGATYELSTETPLKGGQGVDWALKVDAGSVNVEHDSTGKITKELSFDIKQVAGLNVKWAPNFDQVNGLNLGALNLNYAHEKAHLALSADLPTPNAADFELSLAPFTKCKALTVGLTGTLGTSGLSNGRWAYHIQKGNFQMTHQSKNLTDLLDGKCSMYQYLPDNKNFCCYGVEFDSGKLALAAATGCCANTTRFKVNHTGTLSVANVKKLNSALSLNISADVNLNSLADGGHKFGVGLSFE